MLNNEFSHPWSNDLLVRLSVLSSLHGSCANSMTSYGLSTCAVCKGLGACNIRARLNTSLVVSIPFFQLVNDYMSFILPHKSIEE